MSCATCCNVSSISNRTSLIIWSRIWSFNLFQMLPETAPQGPVLSSRDRAQWVLTLSSISGLGVTSRAHALNASCPRRSRVAEIPPRRRDVAFGRRIPSRRQNGVTGGGQSAVLSWYARISCRHCSSGSRWGTAVSPEARARHVGFSAHRTSSISSARRRRRASTMARASGMASGMASWEVASFALVAAYAFRADRNWSR
mmetsp:Transcript_14149/g.30940  ORF Transcript_14149/g.30940 Transcript_14149/m.30940 type:complete len:200 (-) Transcript_14149:227-826(-)